MGNQERLFFSVIVSLAGLVFPILSNAQWWNPLEPRDFDECMIKNLKPGMGEDAVNALRYSCMKKYPPKSSPEEQLATKKADEKYKRCRIERDHYKTHMFLARGSGSRNNSKTNEVLLNLKDSKYDSSSGRVSFQNMNSFGVSGVMVGFTSEKNCPAKTEDYRFSTYCSSGFTESGVSNSAYGSFKCGSLPNEAKSLGFCLIGYSPRYNQFDESLLEFLEKNNYCN